MAIHAISDNGDMHWKCLGLQEKCQKDNYAHVTHDEVIWADDSHVRLPRCTSCGALCTIRVNFTDEEKQADNRKQYGMVPIEMMLPHAITGEQIPVMIPALKPIGVNPYFERHEYVAQKLREHGKYPSKKAPVVALRAVQAVASASVGPQTTPDIDKIEAEAHRKMDEALQQEASD